MDLVADPGLDQQSRFAEALELPVCGAGAPSGESDQLGALEPPVGLGEEQPEESRLDGREEDIGDGEGALPILGMIIPDMGMRSRTEGGEEAVLGGGHGGENITSRRSAVAPYRQYQLVSRNRSWITPAILRRRCRTDVRRRTGSHSAGSTCRRSPPRCRTTAPRDRHPSRTRRRRHTSDWRASC